MDCGKPVDTEHPLSMWEVAGFVKARRRGVNAPRFKVETGRWLCPECANKRARNVAAEQERLFG